MLKNTSTYPRATQVLEEYRRWVLAQSKANLSKSKKNASGDLKKSIRGYIDKKFNRGLKGRFTGGSSLPSLRFEMNHYGAFVDEGVKGTKSNYIENSSSPYKFRGNKKSVPIGPIKKWLAAKGGDQKLAFLIARSIYQKGIKRSLFFSKPFNSRYKSTIKRYHSAVADDIAKNFADKIVKKLKEGKNIT